MNLFSKKEKNELVAVFDIGSSSVGAALFYKNSSGSPEIIFSVREEIPITEKLEFNRFLDLGLKALEEVAKKISLSGLGAPKKTYCTLSSPWYASQTRTIKLEKNTPFIFTAKMADGLIQKEIALFEEEHINQYATTDKKARIIEFKNMKTTLNGYVTTAPIGEKASKVEMVLFMSMSPESVLQKFEESIGRHLHSKGIIFSSLAINCFTVARDMFIMRESFLLIDIGGEVTDISMVKKEILCESISFPMGKNFLYRSLAELLGQTIDQAKSLFALYREGHAEEVLKVRIDESLIKVKADWLKNFQNSLVNLSNDISIPSVIFTTADEDVSNWFVETIKNEQFNQYTLTESKFKLVVLDTQTLHGIASFKDGISRDRFIILESIYINRFLK
ncbi:MAG: hypothetical protein NTW62_03300 [Candidatus Nomurabacteria bacterium]|nr:hypothetical protein [Candidatus Nomurabacteria bacterium]